MDDFGITELELRERITVKLDVVQFNAKEDESVWLQSKGKAPFVCEVYFDAVWCCDLHESDSHEKLTKKYFNGFLKGYESGKIRLNRYLAQIADEQEAKSIKEAKKKVVDAMPSSNPEEKIAKQVVKEIVQEDNAN